MPVPYPTAALHAVPEDFPLAPTGTEPFSPDVYRERRARLLARLKPGVAVVFAAREIDEDTENRQDANFAYLTGLAHEEKAALLLLPGSVSREVLFLEPKNDENDRWTGYRGGLPSRSTEVLTGFDEVRRVDQLPFSLSSSRAHPTIGRSRSSSARRGSTVPTRRTWSSSTRSPRGSPPRRSWMPPSSFARCACRRSRARSRRSRARRR